RHTRSYGDWSSDVCSSDLDHVCPAITGRFVDARAIHEVGESCESGDGPDFARGDVHGAGRGVGIPKLSRSAVAIQGGGERAGVRSEERRVGKEWRGRGGRE